MEDNNVLSRIEQRLQDMEAREKRRDKISLAVLCSVFLLVAVLALVLIPKVNAMMKNYYELSAQAEQLMSLTEGLDKETVDNLSAIIKSVDPDSIKALTEAMSAVDGNVIRSAVEKLAGLDTSVLQNMVDNLSSVDVNALNQAVSALNKITGIFR